YPGTVGGALSIGEKEMIELFSAEQVPMQLTGPFLKTQAIERDPEMEGNIALTPPFKDVTSGYLITGSGVSLSSQSEHPELAWEFIKHLLSDKVASKMVKEKSLFFRVQETLRFLVLSIYNSLSCFLNYLIPVISCIIQSSLSIFFA
ncbi:unnamed protein product, partial [marine sediment metagenome]